ncbi:hypothetical protein EDB87DRAFT_1539572, partial [Lactarius vividus]
YLIDKLLSHSGRRLCDWDSMPQFVENWGAIFGNPLIREQRQYDPEELAQLAVECLSSLNQDQ